MESTNQTHEVNIKTKAIAKWAFAFSILSVFITAYATFRPFDKENFIVEGAKELLISEDWGQLNFFQYFVIRNDGKKQGSITSIDALIVPIEGQKFEEYISAKYYGVKNDYYPIVNISLSSDWTFEYFLI